MTADPFSRIGRRAVPPDRSRALDRAAIEKLLTSPRVPLRERCIWSLLYDSAARSAEILRLDVPDLDLANHRARVTRKGGGHDIVIWKSRTARLLSNYLEGRRDGPVFVTERGAKSDGHFGPADLDSKGQGTAVLRAGRGHVPRVDDDAARPAGNTAPAPALCPDSRRRRRRVGAAAHDEKRPRVFPHPR